MNTIFYDTAFLQTANQTIKNNLETLFKDYTKPIGHTNAIKECRNQDDWDTITTKLNFYLAQTTKAPDADKRNM